MGGRHKAPPDWSELLAEVGPDSAAPARRRRARSLGGALGVTALAAVVPGGGYLWAGRRLLGGGLLALAVGAAAAAAYYFKDLDTIVDFVFDPARLRVAAAAIGTVFLVWAASVVTTYLMVRPRPMRRWQGATGGLLVGLLCLAVAAPMGLGARYAMVQADLVTDVFKGNKTATAPTDVTERNPWGDRDRVNVLLLGGDGSVTRDGVRTDSVVLMSMDTATGRSVMFSLPRNMMNAQFPEGTPLHDLYPEGFSGEGDPAFWMLNAVYGQVPIRHPGLLGASENEGADAVKLAVSGSLGVPVDYYVLVNLDGFKQIVDAMGGVTVNINKPVAIHGDQDAGIPPVDYLDPGPNQRLNGYEALWFARGRYGSSDYERMERQRCMINAIIDEAQPMTLLRRYQELAAAGKEILRTDIPSHLLPAFVDLSLRIKDADVRSVAFVSSDAFYPGDPDFEWLHAAVQKALVPPEPRRPGEPRTPEPRPTPSEDPTGLPGESPTESPTESAEPDPGAAVEVADSCAYHPEQ